jgi:hypothetical protein
MNSLLPQLVYDLPIAIVALLVVGGSLLSSLLLLLIFHRLLPVDLRSAHNDVAGFTIAIVGVIYAVLLAFIAVSAWESHGKAQEIVQMEANAVGNLYVDSIGLPPRRLHDRPQIRIASHGKRLVPIQTQSAGGGSLRDSRGDVGRYLEWRSINNRFQLFLWNARFPHSSGILRNACGFSGPGDCAHAGA